MQRCVYVLFNIYFSSSMCYNTISNTYDIYVFSLIINYSDTSIFRIHEMHDTTYDTPIVGSLRNIRPFRTQVP
jgi:hypothetical protein